MDFDTDVFRSASKGFLRCSEIGLGEGFYFLPRPDRTAIIAIHHLPKTLETLWLRLFGRGEIQRQAIAEVLALPPTHPYRQETLKHLTVLQINLKARQNKTKEIREIMMSVSLVYEKLITDTLAEGKQAERRSIALKMLKVGTSPDFVVQVTGYTLDEVKALQQATDS